MDITTKFPLPWSVGSYGFDIKAANTLHVDEICSAGDEDGDKDLAALICRAVNSHDALVKALQHSYSRFEEMAAQFDRVGDSVNFALCSRDASMTASVLSTAKGAA